MIANFRDENEFHLREPRRALMWLELDLADLVS
jgi:hypothetical protein